MTAPQEDPLLAAAWALDALDDDERAAYEERLAAHPEERADAEALRETASRLAVGVEPPARLRASILDAIAATPQDQPQDQPQGHRAPGPPVVDLTAARERRAPRRGPSRWSVLVAAAGILVAAAGVGFGLAAQPDEAPAPSAQQLARQQVGDLLTAPGATVSTVAVTGGGTATLVRAEGRIGVLTSDLPVAGTGRGYQLWLATGDTLTSAGMLTVSAAGGSATVVDAGRATGVGISVEPAGGSQQPTTTPVVFTPLAV
ncbi:anti-sigma factor [Kineococcus rhizosphaerae]|uniref:Regulator of SigK n=1 Tax=Kineococcus rhizosphaerae TaxID=559628 RepID=A0A2T0R3T0_9ACTN|nr:anti-sigma factor [Kineococcus rhizosphaerae]PRY14717.1 anti-sigma-K factor rskA [Kineococcus rhizosphaerae]